MGNSSSSTTIINQTININVPPDAPNAPPQPFVDSLLNWLIKLFDGDAPKITGDPQKDLDGLNNLLLAVATQHFRSFFGYDYNGSGSIPLSWADDGTFVNFDDFTNCPTTERQKVADYLNFTMFGNDSIVPTFALKPMRADLLAVIEQLLSGSPFDGWVAKTHNRLYRKEGDASQLPIAVNATFIYTIVNAADANGDLTPTMFLYFVGGFYHGKSL